MTLGERLQIAVDRKYDNAHQFQKDMAARKAKGSAYPSIHSYLKGKSVPSLEFLQEAAELLGVRPVWLAFEEGAPTEMEEIARLRQAREDADADPRVLDLEAKVDAVIDKHFPMLERAPGYSHGVVWHTISVLGTELMYQAEGETEVEESRADEYVIVAAELVTRFLGLPTAGFFGSGRRPDPARPVHHGGVPSTCGTLDEHRPSRPHR